MGENVRQLLNLCARYRCKIFASILRDQTMSHDEENYLRKDYVFLFERFYYFLEDKNFDTSGVIVFDELEKAQSHILLQQMEQYFKMTEKGRQRASLVIPEPFFVHSDLNTGIQIADIVAYLLSWGFRIKGMNKPARPELSEFIELMKPLRYRTHRNTDLMSGHEIWSVKVI